MSGIAAAVVGSVAVLTAAALAAIVFELVRGVTTLRASVKTIQARLQPTLAELNRETSIIQRELASLSDAAARLRRP